MALVPDGLWDVIEPLLPLPRPKPLGGRPRLADRACLRRILFVLRSGIPWETVACMCSNLLAVPPSRLD